MLSLLKGPSITRGAKPSPPFTAAAPSANGLRPRRITCAVSSGALRRALLSALFICFGLAATTARAEYLFDAWNTENGLPQNTVSALLQTRDGYLWMTTSDGLVRYDGARFAVFNKGNTPGVTSNRFTALFESGDGTLWAGTENGTVTRYKDGQFSTHEIVGSPSVNSIWSFREDRRLGMLILTRRGNLARWDGERFVPYRFGDDRERAAQPGPAPLVGTNSRFAWLDERGLHLFEDGSYRTYAEREGLPKLNVASILEDQRGNLWLAAREGKLCRFRDGQFTIFQLKNSTGSDVRVVLEDRSGNIWVGMASGQLHLLRNGELTTLGTEHGLPRRELRAIYEDREGTVWIGSYADGLYRARRRAITVLSEAEGLVGENTYPVLEDRDGGVWIGVWGVGVYRFKDGRLTRFAEIDGTRTKLITALFQDREGRLLVGTSVLRQFKDDRFVPFGRDADFKGSAIYAIHQDRDGVYWVGASNGLYRINGETTTALTTADGLPNNTVQVIKEDRRGRLWFGTLGGLCVRELDGKFRSFTEREGLASDHVRAIHEDADGVLWIGTYDGGISRLADGKFTNYTIKNGLFNNGAFQILEDDRGNFWVSCNKGIYRASRSEMNEVASGRRMNITSISYGRSDGMLSIECNGGKQPAGLRARDGRLWFPTQRGIAIVDPTLVETNRLPPPVVIEEGIVEGKTFNPRASGDGIIHVLPGEGSLEIRYTGLSFITPENVQFRYRLAGLDENWVEAGARRAAYYQYLPPGEYTFQVIAANRDGIWNTEGASLRIIVQPPYWRTWWFTLLAVAACTALAFFAYRWRVSKLERARAAQAAFSEKLIESQEGERKRIAAELHDGLGQNLLVIKNRAMLSLSTPENKERAIEQLDEISSIASQTIEEVREIAHNLRPFQLDRLGLTKALQSIVRKVKDSSDIEFTAEIESIDGLFSKEGEINLYRIVQESLNNIVKHSGATAAHLSVTRDARGVVIRVQDNGKGFDRAAHSARMGGANGFGLTGIAERARILGGKETIRSAPHEGTTIILEIALPNGSGFRDAT